MAGKLPVILLIMDAGNNNSVERSYVYAGAQPVAFYDGDYTDPAYIYLHDRLGSVRQVLDESGNVKNTYTYTPFGQDPNSQFAETVDNPFRSTGQWYDSEIDQYYLRARQYEPQLMRFTSIDPIRGKFERPLSLHVYLYCANDPLNRIDYSGETWATAITGGIIGGVAMHSAAISITAFGVATGNDTLLELGIFMENNMVAPAIVIGGVIGAGGPVAFGALLTNDVIYTGVGAMWVLTETVVMTAMLHPEAFVNLCNYVFSASGVAHSGDIYDAAGRIANYLAQETYDEYFD